MLAHTLKGLAGTLGMHDLQQPASLLERACIARQDDDVALAQARLARVMTPLLAGLQKYFTAEAVAADAAVAATQLPAQEYLRRLRKLLDEGDSDAIDLWQQHGHDLAGMLSPALRQRIDIALQNFEFDTAPAMLADATPEQETA